MERESKEQRSCPCFAILRSSTLSRRSVLFLQSFHPTETKHLPALLFPSRCLLEEARAVGLSLQERLDSVPRSSARCARRLFLSFFLFLLSVPPPGCSPEPTLSLHLSVSAIAAQCLPLRQTSALSTGILPPATADYTLPRCT